MNVIPPQISLIMILLSLPGVLLEGKTPIEVLSSDSQKIMIKRSADQMIMTSIPAGEFFMGSDEPLHDGAEKPSILVKMSAYWIDQFEINQGQYGACIKAGACNSKISGSLSPSRSDLPMTGISWDEARAYCQWLGMDLPTEAQWEFASRGTLSMVYPWGNSVFPTALRTDLSHNISYPESLSGPLSATTSMVYDRSSFGIFNLAGNVSEWALDTAEISESGVTLPRKLAPAEQEKRKSVNFFSKTPSDYRVVKGANFGIFFPSFLRGSFRRGVEKQFKIETIGFRCAANVAAIQTN